MNKIAPLMFGLAGAAILISLGVWQVQRLAEKEEYLAAIEARISEAPEPLPALPDPDRDTFMPVSATGEMGADYVRILVSQKRKGAGYRVISPLTLDDGRSVLLDRGIAPVAAPLPTNAGRVDVVGNLHWPNEVDSFTPEHDRDGNIWFARDVAALATHLGTDPVLIVVRDATFDDAPIAPVPVDTAGIPNDHLQYAITWFSLAVIWLGMTAYFLRRQGGGDSKRM